MDRKKSGPGPLVPDLPAGYLEAGRDFHSALVRLGLDPELTMWARDAAIDDWVLLICTTLYDAVGPLSLMRLFFKAYDAAATPRAIDPFILRLQSPKQPAVALLIKTLDHQGETIRAKDEAGEPVELTSAEWEDLTEVFIGELSALREWRYVAGKASKSPTNAFKTFKSFKRAVEANAA